jgi:hypothetical protein
VKGRRAGGTPNMAAAGVAARSPGTRARRPPPPRAARLLVLLAAALAGPGAGGAARLYHAGEDAVWMLDSGSVRGATANSSAAWLVQFYSSWCGHCIGYAPTWRALAEDVRGEGPARRARVPSPRHRPALPRPLPVSEPRQLPARTPVVPGPSRLAGRNEGALSGPSRHRGGPAALQMAPRSQNTSLSPQELHYPPLVS